MVDSEKRKRELKLFVFPTLVIVLFLNVIPISYTAYLSFRSFDLMRGTNHYVGLKNYVELLFDPLFFKVLINTGIYISVEILIGFLLAFSMALICYQSKLFWSKVLRSIFILPLILIPSAGAMVWRQIMYHSPYEELNRLFGLPNLLGRSATALGGVLVAVLWSATPWIFILLLATMEDLPKEPIEAAKIDGASFRQIVWHIILPLMKPIIIIVLSLRALDSFRAFSYIWIMTEGGPGNSSHTLSTYVYQSGFKLLKYGYGSAMAFVMFVIAFVVMIGTVTIMFKRS